MWEGGPDPVAAQLGSLEFHPKEAGKTVWDANQKGDMLESQFY